MSVLWFILGVGGYLFWGCITAGWIKEDAHFILCWKDKDYRRMLTIVVAWPLVLLLEAIAGVFGYLLDLADWAEKNS